MDRAEVVVLGPEHGVLAEQLEPSGRRPAHDLMPDAGERRVHSGARTRAAATRDVLDARVAEGLGRRRAHRGRRTENPLHEIDVVDRVLDQRAAAGLVDVGSPGRAVHPLDREVLVVAKDHRHRSAVATGRDRLRELREHRRVPQHEADLVRMVLEPATRSAGTPRWSARAASRRTPRDLVATAASTPPRGRRSRCRSTRRRRRRARRSRSRCAVAS